MDYVDVLLETLKTHDEEIIYFNWADFNSNEIITHPTNYALWKAIYKRNIFPRFERKPFKFLLNFAQKIIILLLLSFILFMEILLCVKK